MIPPSVERNLQIGSEFDTFAGRVKLSRVVAGHIEVRDGPLVLFDAGYPEDASALQTRLPRGTFPLVFCLADYPDKDQRIAAAWIEFQEGEPTQWNEATPQGIGIDTGICAMMSGITVDALQNLPAKQREQYLNRLDQVTEKSYRDTRSWGTVPVMDQFSAFVFSSGFGEGGFGIYTGGDQSGKLMCLLIDFGLLLTEDEIEQLGGAEDV